MTNLYPAILYALNIQLNNILLYKTNGLDRRHCLYMFSSIQFNSIQFMTTVCSHVLTLQVQVLHLLTVHVSKCFLFCPVLSQHPVFIAFLIYLFIFLNYRKIKFNMNISQLVLLVMLCTIIIMRPLPKKFTSI